MTAQKKSFPILWIVTAFVLVLATAAVLALSADTATGLPVLAEVPSFTLTSQHAESFSGDHLKGQVWVADLIFTTCSGPCLRMTSQMYRLQEAMRDVPTFRTVSISVDPVRDTPERLTWYADMTHADPDRWVFLTGDMDSIRNLAMGGFKLAVENNAGEEPDPNAILHSDKFVLVDQNGRIRGYYDGMDETEFNQLVEDAHALAANGA